MSIKKTAVKKVVLLRHGESQWNQENRFTGWTDIDLSSQGVTEALQAGQLLQAQHFTFDVAFTSVLKRAIRTLWIILEQMDLLWLTVEKSWKLNERHYGALQGLNKIETVQQYGAEQVQQWRRAFTVTPPALTSDDPRFPGHDRRYSTLLQQAIPRTESLAMTIERVVPYWQHVIQPRIANGASVLIVAHGNSLRALMKYLGDLSETAILGLNIPTGVPLIYEFDDQMRPLQHYYLGDPTAIAARQQLIANQTAAK